jgi:predicted nuclease of predicted toxin-antitoxin system
MYRLIIDEMMSPTLVPDLWAREIDTIHVRDRALLQISDHALWKYAISEDRTVVTCNGKDFAKLAAREPTHPGIISVPSGGHRAEQLSYVMGAIAWATLKGPVYTFANQYVEVGVTLEIVVEEIRLESLLPGEIPGVTIFHRC